VLLRHEDGFGTPCVARHDGRQFTAAAVRRLSSNAARRI
jgi:hypothetical protein